MFFLFTFKYFSAMGLLNETTNRIASPTPSYFVKLRWLAGFIAAIAGVIATQLPNEVWNPPFMQMVDTACEYITAAAATGWLSTFLPKKDAANATKRN